MQLYAYDTTGRALHASVASKQTDYACLECSENVRVRGGIYRQKHFYHLSKNRSCKLSGKTLEHINVQNFIKETLPAGECTLEHPFPVIGRIADVAWHEKNIVFEVQCSSITPEEISSRNRDYLSEGYQVVWILHEKKYQKRKESEVERFLHDCPHYYTNIDAHGNGCIYDLLRGITDDRERRVLGPYQVDLSAPINIPFLGNGFPGFIQRRSRSWPFCFSGDYLSRCTDHDWSVGKMPVLETGYFSRVTGFFRLFATFYRTFFRMMLEKFSC